MLAALTSGLGCYNCVSSDNIVWLFDCKDGCAMTGSSQAGKLCDCL